MIIKAGSPKNQTLDRVPFNYYKNQTLAKALKGPHSFVKSRDLTCSTSYWILKEYVTHLDDEALCWIDQWSLQMRLNCLLARVMRIRYDWSRK